MESAPEEKKIGTNEKASADDENAWFPTGVDNAVCINGEKVAEGPGAGGRATAERMFKDFKELDDRHRAGKIILIGYGTVGKEVEKVLRENGRTVDLVVRSSGIYSNGNRVDDPANFATHVEAGTTVFICIPSVGDAEALDYYRDALEQNASVVTCEKAVLANHWDLVETYPYDLRYSATVGGDSGILPAIRAYKGEIKEIRAVVNGTLGYVATELAKGRTKEEVFAEALERGYAEPGARSFEELIQAELKDVTYKTVILANHSGLYDHIVTVEEVQIAGYRDGARCSVFLDGTDIRAGFLS